MEKDTKNEIANQRDIQRDSQVSEALLSFVKDPRSLYLYKKSEKISKAFFLLTRHLSDTNTIRNHMRDKALQLIYKAQGLISSEKDKTYEAAAQAVAIEAMSLISLSDTARAAEVQSEKNHAIVVRELETFLTELSTWSNEHSKLSNSIPASLFDMSDISMGLFNSPTFAKDSHVFKEVHKQPASHLHATSSVRQPSQQLAQKRVSGSPSQSNGEKNERQETILQTVKERGELSIKDLTEVIKGCSEKTIQRELIAMVSAGVLLKTGDRRWSRYSIPGR